MFKLFKVLNYCLTQKSVPRRHGMYTKKYITIYRIEIE